VPYQSHSRNIYISYVCLYLSTLQCYSCPSNHNKHLGHSHSLFNAHSSILLPVLPTDHITCHNLFNPLIMDTFHKKELQFRGHTDSIHICSWIELNVLKSKKCQKNWMAFQKVRHSGFHWPVKFSICLIIPTNSGVYF